MSRPFANRQHNHQRMPVALLRSSRKSSFSNAAIADMAPTPKIIYEAKSPVPDLLLERVLIIDS
jgi:hypothetical protein